MVIYGLEHMMYGSYAQVTVCAVHHVSKCMSCREAICRLVITEKAVEFLDDRIYTLITDGKILNKMNRNADS